MSDYSVKWGGLCAKPAIFWRCLPPVLECLMLPRAKMSCSVGRPGEEIPLFVSPGAISGLGLLRTASCCQIISYYGVVETLEWISQVPLELQQQICWRARRTQCSPRERLELSLPSLMETGKVINSQPCVQIPISWGRWLILALSKHENEIKPTPGAMPVTLAF